MAEAGDYAVTATVAANGSGSILFKVGDKVVSDTLAYTGESWTAFDQVKGNIKLEAGEQILTLEISKGYIDVDWFEISNGSGNSAIGQKVHFDSNTRQNYIVFDTHGVRLGVLSAYGFDAAKQILKSSNEVKSSGIYYLRNRTSGEMHSVRIAK